MAKITMKYTTMIAISIPVSDLWVKCAALWTIILPRLSRTLQHTCRSMPQIDTAVALQLTENRFGTVSQQRTSRNLAVVGKRPIAYPNWQSLRLNGVLLYLLRLYP